MEGSPFVDPFHSFCLTPSLQCVHTNTKFHSRYGKQQKEKGDLGLAVDYANSFINEYMLLPIKEKKKFIHIEDIQFSLIKLSIFR